MAKFLECGVPLLDRDIKLIISGSGPDAERIREIWKENDLQNRVLLLYLSDEELGFIRREADLFIMPNVPYPNDVGRVWHYPSRMYVRWYACRCFCCGCAYGEC